MWPRFGRICATQFRRLVSRREICTSVSIELIGGSGGGPCHWQEIEYRHMHMSSNVCRHNVHVYFLCHSHFGLTPLCLPPLHSPAKSPLPCFNFVLFPLFPLLFHTYWVLQASRTPELAWPARRVAHVLVLCRNHDR